MRIELLCDKWAKKGVIKGTSRTPKALLAAGILLLGFALVGPASAQTCVPTPSGLLSWLPGEGTTDDIVDGNHGTLEDGATFGTGLIGQAFSFDGIGSVTLSFDPPLSTGSFTYDLWINVSSYFNGSINGLGGLGSYFVDRVGSTFRLASLKAVNDQFGFQVRYDGEFTPFGAVGGPISTGVWTHVAMVREFGVGFHLYVNGSLVDSALDSGSPLTPPTPRLGHLTLPNLEGFVGLIDEFEIFDRALTASEIEDIFDAGSAGKCPVVPNVPTLPRSTLGALVLLLTIIGIRRLHTLRG